MIAHIINLGATMHQFHYRRIIASAVSLSLLIVACGSGNKSIPGPAETSTRAIELTTVAAMRQEEVTKTSGATSTRPMMPTPTTGSVIPPATMVPSPTFTLTATASATATATTPPTAPPEDPSALLELLPTLDDLPAGFAITAEEIVDAPTFVASWAGDPSTLLDQLSAWGFVGAANRSFEIPSPGLDALSKTVLYQVSVTELGSPDAAHEEMQASLQQFLQVGGGNLSQVSVDKLADETIAVQGSITQEGSTAIIASIWVRDGRHVFVFRGASVGANPMSDVTDLAKKSLARVLVR